MTGFVRVLVFGYQPPEPTAVIETAGDVTVFLILRAFASGYTALTGVEAVSNGVPSFRDPSAKNAKRVLGLMALTVGVTFISIAVLKDIYHIVPQEGVTAIASLASAVFGSGSVCFYVFQIATVVILSLAANTAYAGMPLLLAMVARRIHAAPLHSARRKAELLKRRAADILRVLGAYLPLQSRHAYAAAALRDGRVHLVYDLAGRHACPLGQAQDSGLAP